jgi:hypothetical protein
VKVSIESPTDQQCNGVLLPIVLLGSPLALFLLLHTLLRQKSCMRGDLRTGDCFDFLTPDFTHFPLWINPATEQGQKRTLEPVIQAGHSLMPSADLLSWL